MKICDKIREIYSLYQEYYRVYRKALAEDREIGIGVRDLCFNVIDKLAIEYFGSRVVGIVISRYCWDNTFYRTTENYTVYQVLYNTRAVAEWYQEKYDSGIDVEEVVRKIERLKEWEKVLENRTRYLEEQYDRAVSNRVLEKLSEPTGYTVSYSELKERLKKAKGENRVG